AKERRAARGGQRPVGFEGRFGETHGAVDLGVRCFDELGVERLARRGVRPAKDVGAGSRDFAAKLVAAVKIHPSLLPAATGAPRGGASLPSSARAAPAASAQ